MTSQIDFRTLPNNVPSLCIPRVFSNWTESRIRRIFDDLSMGEILRIDVVSKTTEKGEKFNRVFVHFKQWFSNQNADMARERLLNGKEIKIVYDDPWFWKVSAYREPNKKSEHRPDKEERPRASIRFDDDVAVAKGRPPVHHEHRPPVHHERRPLVQHEHRPLVQHEHRPPVQHEHNRPPVQHERRPPVHHERRPLVQHEHRPPVHHEHRPPVHHEHARSLTKPSHEDEPRDRRDIKPDTKQVIDNHLDDINNTNDTVASSTSTKESAEIDIDYGKFPIPKKRRIFIKKEPVVAPLKIEMEEGEIAEEVVENK